MVESERAELCISANDGEYCGLLHLYALANLLNMAIVSIYPSVHNVRVDIGLLKQVLLPFHCVNPTTEPVHIIWTSLTAKQVGCIWQSNQFVACVPRFPQSQPPCTLPTSQRSNHSHYLHHQRSIHSHYLHHQRSNHSQHLHHQRSNHSHHLHHQRSNHSQHLHH